jgi:hypothetical protein
MAILVGIVLFFMVIALTVILGSISKMGDKRVDVEGRATEGQRPPTDREAHGY